MHNRHAWVLILVATLLPYSVPSISASEHAPSHDAKCQPADFVDSILFGTGGRTMIRPGLDFVETTATIDAIGFNLTGDVVVQYGVAGGLGSLFWYVAIFGATGTVDQPVAVEWAFGGEPDVTFEGVSGRHFVRGQSVCTQS